MSFYRQTPVARTRKASFCKWCYEAINSGDPSVVIAQKFEGDFHTDRYHPECADAITRWGARNRYDETLPEEPMNRGGVMPRGETEPEETP
jgi:hypothetical protein